MTTLWNGKPSARIGFWSDPDVILEKQYVCPTKNNFKVAGWKLNDFENILQGGGKTRQMFSIWWKLSKYSFHSQNLDSSSVQYPAKKYQTESHLLWQILKYFSICLHNRRWKKQEQKYFKGLSPASRMSLHSYHCKMQAAPAGRVLSLSQSFSSLPSFLSLLPLQIGRGSILWCADVSLRTFITGKQWALTGQKVQYTVHNLESVSLQW